MDARRRLALVGGLLVLAGALSWIGLQSAEKETGVSYSHFLQQARAGEVTAVVIHDDTSGPKLAVYRLKGGTLAETVLPADYVDAMAVMQNSSVDIQIQASRIAHLFINASPFLLLLVVWFLLMFRWWRRPDLPGLAGPAGGMNTSGGPCRFSR